MAQTATTDGGNADETQRFTTDLSLADAQVGDRVDPHLIPRTTEIEVGDRVGHHIAQPNPAADPDERTYSVRTVCRDERGQFRNVQDALVYDPEADLFARLSGHTSGAGVSQKERDWKVRDIGSAVEVVDVDDADIPDLEDDDEARTEYVAEWVDLLIGNARFGHDVSHEIETFDGKSMRLRDYDGRTAWVQYELVAGGDE